MDIGQYLKNKDFALSKPTNGTPRNARQAVLQEALDIINPDRIKAGFTPLTMRALEARYTGTIKSLFDLQWHVKECQKASNFSKCFFGKLKAKQIK